MIIPILLFAGCDAFTDKATETGLLDSEASSCSGMLEPQAASGVTVLQYTVNGVGRVLGATSLCVHPQGTLVEVSLDDAGTATRVRVQETEQGVYNLPGSSVEVVGASTWGSGDFYAGTLTLGEGSGGLVGEATNGGADSLSIDLSWSWSASPF